MLDAYNVMRLNSMFSNFKQSPEPVPKTENQIHLINLLGKHAVLHFDLSLN